MIPDHGPVRVPGEWRRRLVLAATAGTAITAAAAGWSGRPTLIQMSMALAGAALASVAVRVEPSKKTL
jgi:hypothetical protein